MKTTTSDGVTDDRLVQVRVEATLTVYDWLRFDDYSDLTRWIKSVLTTAGVMVHDIDLAEIM